MDQNPISFEKITLPEVHKEELESIGQRAAEKQVDYTAKGIEKPRRDVFKEVLGERMQARGVQPVPVPTQATKPNPVNIEEKTRTLQSLVNLAATKGPVEASLEVKKMGDPWLEDQFHDVLISFHDELVKRKKLEAE